MLKKPEQENSWQHLRARGKYSALSECHAATPTWAIDMHFRGAQVVGRQSGHYSPTQLPVSHVPTSNFERGIGF